MRPLNQLSKFPILLIIWFGLTSCGDHSKTTVDSGVTSPPTINLTSGPYVVIVDKNLIVGVETKFAKKEPIYTAVPSPIGIAIVNQILPGQIIISGVKAGNTTFTISDLANPTAVAQTLLVSVKDAPTLAVKPAVLTGRVNQSLLIEVSTLNSENTPVYTYTVNNTTIGRILDPVNNPSLVDLIKVGTTTITITDSANNISQNFDLTVTP
jgi:hypothetical protein